MLATTYDSVSGKVGRVDLDDEKTIIVALQKETTEAIEIDIDKRLIRIYERGHWTILPMDRDQRFDPKAKIIGHIDEFERR